MVVGAVGTVVLVGRYLIPIALAAAAKSRNEEAFIMFALLAVLGAAYAMELVGVSMALGAISYGNDVLGVRVPAPNRGFRCALQRRVDRVVLYLWWGCPSTSSCW